MNEQTIEEVGRYERGETEGLEALRLFTKLAATGDLWVLRGFPGMVAANAMLLEIMLKEKKVKHHVD